MDLPRRLALPFVIVLTLAGAQAWAAAPTIVSLNPASGSGQTQTFTLTASDSDGAADISSIDLLINSTFSNTNACWIYYDHVANRVQLAGDSGGWNSSSIGPGQTPGFSNSQCSVEFVSSSDAGNSVSVSLNITFNGAWLGDRIIWGESLDKAKNDSMYQQMGTWTASSSGPAADFTVSATPTHQSTTPGHTADYNIVITSVNGFSGTVTLTSSYSPDPGGLTIREGLSYPYTFYLGAGGTSQRTIHVDTSSTTTPTDNVTISLTYSDNNLQHTVPVTLTILPATAPAISISPTSGSGSTQTFTITASDPGGFAAISGINFLINSTLDGRNACWLYYQPQGNQSDSLAQGILTLAGDDGSDWSRSVNLDSAHSSPPSIQNSQCNVFGGPTGVRGNGDTLTLTITLTFTSSFAGNKNLYVRASDQAGPATDYNPLGTFTAVGGSGAPDFSFVIDPASVTVTGSANGSYAINLTGTNGYNGTVSFTVSGLPPGSSVDPGPTPTTPSAGPSYFVVHVPGTTATGTYTITVTGTDGTLTHTATTTMYFTTAPLPALSASPNSGTGATQTFTFTSTGTASAQPNAMNVLFNTRVDGSSACWMYFGNANSVALASDDGSLWTSMGPTSPPTGNSQCTLSGFTMSSGSVDNQWSFTVTITFSHAFAGTKNIYLRGNNTQGGDTGYEIAGNWTVP